MEKGRENWILWEAQKKLAVLPFSTIPLISGATYLLAHKFVTHRGEQFPPPSSRRRPFGRTNRPIKESHLPSKAVLLLLPFIPSSIGALQLHFVKKLYTFRPKGPAAGKRHKMW
jgi:hypothetical protein